MLLISMADFVLSLRDEPLPKGFHKHIPDAFHFVSRVIRYAEFLKQPLTLGMFVPCDDQGNVLKEPEGWNWFSIDPCRCEKCKEKYDINALDTYRKAKERILFKGFTPSIINRAKSVTHPNKTVHYQLIKGEHIESIAGGENPLELTESAIKQFM